MAKMVGGATRRESATLTDLAIFDTGECGSEWIGARAQARGAEIIDWRATADASGRPVESSIAMTPPLLTADLRRQGGGRWA